ncbi:MAG: hypothetical protein JSR85_04145 [Proteobacteria bacterium]|nr:hypothetical protein [Pseudomonadota bacterium]
MKKLYLLCMFLAPLSAMATKESCSTCFAHVVFNSLNCNTSNPLTCMLFNPTCSDGSSSQLAFDACCYASYTSQCKDCDSNDDAGFHVNEKLVQAWRACADPCGNDGPGPACNACIANPPPNNN